MSQVQFGMTEQFDPVDMQEVMRSVDIYWAARDALSPPPEAVNFIDHLLHPDTWTLAATLGPAIIGYVQFIKRTSVMAEMGVGFRPQFRGKIAKAMTQYAIGQAFTQKGLLKIIAIISADNRPSRYGVSLLGFRQEGRISNAIVRDIKEGGPPLCDLLVYGLSRGGMN